MGFEDAARQESNFCVAVFGNTAPTLFWAIYEIFSRPELLAEVREEIETNAVEGTEGEDVFRFTLDVAALKTKCPLLLSTYQEVQRSRDSHANIRTVLADTFLDEGRYLLRKGNYCLIPSASVHKSTSIWGESATTFDPYRFTARNTRNGEQRSDLKSGVPPPSSFLAWGNPPYLCPARQYAATEIFILLALLVMQVDLVPVGNKGQWERYPALNTGDLVSVFNPMKDIEVEVKPTKSARGKWMLNMGESKTRIALVSG
jgi:cytochrome P450